MIEVWIAQEHFPYEGSFFLGVGATRADARNICEEQEGRPLQWHEGSTEACGSVVDYTVELQEVRGA